MITVVGEGAWGTAVATVLAYNRQAVFLWCNDPQVKKSIETTRYNDRYLPGVFLSELIIPVTDLPEAIRESLWIFESTPVQFLRSVLSSLDKKIVEDKRWVVLSKGIEKDTLLLPTQLINELFNTTNYVVMFGPSFAHELAKQQLTAVTLATDNGALAQEVQKIVTTDYLKTFMSDDMIGVQCAGAFKNVLALIVGILDGAGCGDNTKAFVLTRGLQEIIQLSEQLGAHAQTFYGLAGIGDLVLTAYGKSSRNVMVGQKMGKGQSLEMILQETGAIPESINTLKSMRELIIEKKLTLPLLMGIYDIVFNRLSVEQFLKKI